MHLLNGIQLLHKRLTKEKKLDPRVRGGDDRGLCEGMRILLMRLLAAAAGALLLLTGVAAAEQRPDPTVKGERVFLKCYSCHTLDLGPATLPGPNLMRIIGRRTANQRGFAYSEAMLRFAAGNGRWTAALLDRYIADPAKMMPGTTMAFPGIRDPAERKELLDYLRAKGQKPS